MYNTVTAEVREILILRQCYSRCDTVEEKQQVAVKGAGKSCSENFVACPGSHCYSVATDVSLIVFLLPNSIPQARSIMGLNPLIPCGTGRGRTLMKSTKQD